MNGTNASAVINCGAGVQVTPYHKDGTITNSRAIWLKDASTNAGGTATNYWGIYQEDTDACNYFAGNVGIGVTAPDQLLHLQKNQNTDTAIRIKNDTGGTLARAAIIFTSNSNNAVVVVADDGYTAVADWEDT